MQNKERVKVYFDELANDDRYSRIGKYDYAIWKVWRELWFCDEWDWHLHDDERYKQAKELIDFLNS